MEHGAGVFVEQDAAEADAPEAQQRQGTAVVQAGATGEQAQRQGEEARQQAREELQGQEDETQVEDKFLAIISEWLEG